MCVYGGGGDKGGVSKFQKKLISIIVILLNFLNPAFLIIEKYKAITDKEPEQLDLLFRLSVTVLSFPKMRNTGFWAFETGQVLEITYDTY